MNWWTVIDTINILLAFLELWNWYVHLAKQNKNIHPPSKKPEILEIQKYMKHKVSVLCFLLLNQLAHEYWFYSTQIRTFDGYFWPFGGQTFSFDVAKAEEKKILLSQG